MKTREYDLTKGNVTKLLLYFAMPMAFSSILQSIYSIADILIAGRTVGSVGISAINNASLIMEMIAKIAIGLALGGEILIGQYAGRKDNENKQKAVSTFFILMLGAGILVTVILLIAGKPLLVLLGAPALAEASAYLQITSFGILFIFGYNGLCGILRAVGDSRTPFRIVLVTVTLNVGLDLLFMSVLHMGVRGAALATMISQGVSFLAALISVLRRPEVFGLHLTQLHFYRDKCIKSLLLGIPCAVQMTVAAISWLFVTYFINSYGVDVSAGNGISIKIKDICQLFIHAVSGAASTMIAQNLGAKLYDRAKKIMYTTMGMTLLISAGMIVVVELAAPLLASAFTSDPAVIEAAVLNMRIEIIGQLFYALFLSYHALATGAGHTWFVLLSSFTNCILVRVVLVYIFNGMFGLPGVYLGCMIAPFSSVPLGIIYTRSNLWKKKGFL